MEREEHTYSRDYNSIKQMAPPFPLPLLLPPMVPMSLSADLHLIRNQQPKATGGSIEIQVFIFFLYRIFIFDIL
jgi:hypothetical protein